jgi:hypothetical protein
MHLARRLVPAALLAVIAGLALTGCRTQPGIASYVGDSRLTDNEVEQLVTTIETDVKNAGGTLQKEAYGNIRQLVVQLTVFNEIARRYAAEKSLTLPEQDYEAAAQQFGLPVTDPFVKLAVDSDAYRNLLLENVQAVTPTEADLRDAYDRIVDAGIQEITFEQVRDELAALPQLRTGISLRNELAAAADRYGVSVNPRYQPVEMPLTSVPGQSGDAIWLVALPLGAAGGTPAVVDR